LEWLSQGGIFCGANADFKFCLFYEHWQLAIPLCLSRSIQVNPNLGRTVIAGMIATGTQRQPFWRLPGSPLPAARDIASESH
jgi:hypothetical protein